MNIESFIAPTGLSIIVVEKEKTNYRVKIVDRMYTQIYFITKVKAESFEQASKIGWETYLKEI